MHRNYILETFVPWNNTMEASVSRNYTLEAEVSKNYTLQRFPGSVSPRQGPTLVLRASGP